MLTKTARRWTKKKMTDMSKNVHEKVNKYEKQSLKTNCIRKLFA